MKEALKDIKVVVLDFDNTIVKGSEEAKREAWYEVFPDYDTEELNNVLNKANEIIAGGKGDRRDVIKIVLEHFGVGYDEIENEIDKYSELFNEIVQKVIVSIGVKPEDRKAIEVLSRETNLYVNTATPIKNSRESLEALGIIDLFKGIYGRPGNKVSNLNEIISIENIRPSELLFVGDQKSDLDAAKEVNCKFVGVGKIGIINSLEELLI